MLANNVRFSGLVLGTAVGDALGLPAENLSAARIQRRWHGQWRMRLLLGRGLISDDTEHTLMVAQALLAEPRDAPAFQRLLARKFRWWFAALPAGVGLATAKACLKLWVGIRPGNSAVKSAGSGPAMRSAVIGAYFASDPGKRRDFVLASSRLTHRGWQAETAALAVAEAAALILLEQKHPDTSAVLARLRQLSPEPEWQNLVATMETALLAQASVPEFASRLGLQRAVSGYALHVTPVALYAWLRHPGDFRAALISALACGGDTDTVGAIVGALAGASVGQEGIPAEWLNPLWEWPRSRTFMVQVAQRLADPAKTLQPQTPVPCFWPGIPPRNLLFLVIVLGHGFRRLFRPIKNAANFLSRLTFQCLYPVMVTFAHPQLCYSSHVVVVLVLKTAGVVSGLFLFPHAPPSVGVYLFPALSRLTPHASRITHQPRVPSYGDFHPSPTLLF
jgi:ADP-ribosylglycohydrolase